MQHRPVRLKLEAGENVALQNSRIGDHRQRLVGMCGHDDLVEPDIALPLDRQDNPALVTPDAGDVRVEMDPATVHAAKRVDQAIHIFAGTAPYRAPLRPVNEIQQLVIFHELKEGANRIVQHCPRRA